MTERPENLILTDYQCPLDPNHVNHVLEMLINVSRLYVQTDPAKAQPIWEVYYSNWPPIILFL